MELFESRAPDKSKMMLYTNKGPFPSSCLSARVCRRKAESATAERVIVDFAHTSIPLSENDAYYGKEGTYVSCVHYLEKNDCDALKRCLDRDSSNVYYGERSEGNLEKGIVRRLTWNPDFKKTLSEMDRFVDSTLSAH